MGHPCSVEVAVTPTQSAPTTEDNVAALPPPEPTIDEDDIILTRYLYIKDEVQYALLTNLLQRDQSALFWSYELYYSGFTEDWWNFMWFIYLHFFALSNPGFFAYMKKKQSEWQKDKNNGDRTIAIITQTLMARPFTLDIFLARKLQEVRDKTPSPSPPSPNDQIHSMTFDDDPIHIAQQIAGLPFEQLDEYFTLYLANTTSASTLTKAFRQARFYNEQDRVLLLVHIFAILNPSIPKGRDVYARVKPEDIAQYRTRTARSQQHRLLREVCCYGTDDNKLLHLFSTVRKRTDQPSFEEIYKDWLYWASFCPLWYQRMVIDGGAKIDHDRCHVRFPDGESFDRFDYLYNLEPDEQPAYIKHHLCPQVYAKTKEDDEQNPTNTTNTWRTFYEMFGGPKGFIRCSPEELDAFL